MLKLKSFKMDDDKGMNELLFDYRLAEGASVYVSDGHIIIPYEDGQPMTISQRKIQILENKHRLNAEMYIIDHSRKVKVNKVNEAFKQLKENKIQLEKPESEKESKEIYEHRKQLKDEIKRLEGVIIQFEVSTVNNNAELTAKTEEVKVYNKELEELETQV